MRHALRYYLQNGLFKARHFYVTLIIHNEILHGFLCHISRAYVGQPTVVTNFLHVFPSWRCLDHRDNVQKAHFLKQQHYSLVRSTQRVKDSWPSNLELILEIPNFEREKCRNPRHHCNWFRNFRGYEVHPFILPSLPLPSSIPESHLFGSRAI